jgi:hypothetical protein
LVVIANTGTLLLESTFNELALPTMICPITSKKFNNNDIIHIVPYISSFAASGNVEAKRLKSSMN